jgi:predicted deacylase
MPKKNIFTFAEKQIEPGTKTSILFPAPNINTQVQLNVPVHVFHGKNPGPKLFIIGTIHGDELNSIEIIRRIHQQINVSKLHGTLITVPVANVYGLMTQSRYLPDRRDLNRTFPGAKKDTLATRLAYGLLKIISQCHYGIDYHTGGLGRINMPQLRVNLNTPGARQLAMAFDTPVILDAKLRDGSLRQAASERGIPLLVYEGGEALRFNELCIRAGVRGGLSVMSHLGMIPQFKKHKNTTKPMIAKSSSWVRAAISGFIQPVSQIIAKTVKKGDLLAHIHDPFLINESVKVLAPFDGLVIGEALKPLASEGDALYHIASFKKIAGVRAAIEEYSNDIVAESD